MVPFDSLHDVVAPSEAARLLGLSSRQVLRLADDGHIAHVRTPLGRLLSREAVEDERLRRDTALA